LLQQFLYKKQRTYINKQAFVWQHRGLDANDTGLFIILNKSDANDGDLSIKEYMRKSDKYTGVPLLKRPYRNHYFAWNYKGQHKTPAEYIAAMAPTKLFSQDGETICCLIDGNEKAMDFMYLDAQILELVRNYPDVYGEKEHSTYFADEAHISLAEAHISLAAAD